MAAKVFSVPKQREIQRLKKLGLKKKAVARTLKCSITTVKKYWNFGEQEVVVAPVIESPAWTEAVDWDEVKSEASRGTPVNVLWEELSESGKISVQYAGFWKQLRKRFPNLPATMHRIFAPGSRAEIDYCDGIDLIDPLTGEIRETELFVGVLCNSRYVFAEFSFSQKSEDFLSSHVRMLERFGGVPQVVSPDNLKSAVTKAHRYDPVINPAYTRLAEHYGFAVVPARVRTPKDKAVVERTVQIFQRWFFFRVRHRTFTSLVEINQSLKEHVDVFHRRKHRIFARTRLEMFESEKSALKALPEHRYQVATYWKANLHPDCHLSFDHNFYSAPYALRGKQLDVWATASTIEIYHLGKRVALHARLNAQRRFVTDPKHYPPEHQAYYEATPTWVREQGEKHGPETARLINGILGSPYPLKYLRRAQGILRLAKVYGPANLEMAAARANSLNQNTYPFIERLLKHGCLRESAVQRTPRRGENPLLRQQELFH
jgi:hypothetical protein